MAIIWVLLCVSSCISVIQMGSIMKQHHRPNPGLLKLVWLIPMLIMTTLYRVTISWYVWQSWTSNLYSKFQVFQVFPATFLVFHELVQILFIQHRDYNIKRFVGFFNVSFNLVMLVHLYTCCVDGLKTGIKSSDPILSTAITVSLPFEVTHRTIAVLVFMPNILPKLHFCYRYLIQMIVPHHNRPPALCHAVLEASNRKKEPISNELVMKNHVLNRQSIDSFPKIETLGSSNQDYLITHRPQPSYNDKVTIASNIMIDIPYSDDLLSGMVLKRYQSEVPYHADTTPGYKMADPKPVQLHDSKGGMVHYFGKDFYAPDDPCEHVTPGDCTEGYCLNEASGGVGVFCTGKYPYFLYKGFVPGIYTHDD